MDLKRLISRNLLWQGSTVIVTTIATLMYGLLVARYLGPKDFGRFSLIAGVVGWAIAVAQGGGGNAMIVLSAQDKERAGSLFWPGMAVQLAMGTVAVLLGIPVILIFGKDWTLLLPALIYGLSNIIYLLNSVVIGIFFGLDRMAWGLCNAFASVGMASLMVIVIASDWGFTATVTTSVLAQLVVFAIAVPLCFKQLKITGWHKATASHVWSASAALWGVMLPLSLHWRVGTLAVQAFAGAHELGLYSAAAKLVENLRIVPVYFMLTFVPTFVKLGSSDRDKLRDILEPVIRYVVMIACLFNVVLIALAPFVIHVLYTPEYTPSVSILRISALGLAPLFIDWVFMYVLMSLRMERQLVIIYLVSIAAEVLVDAFLIPSKGARGAAIGFVTGESLAALMGAYCAVRAVGRLSWNTPMKIGIVGVLSMLVMIVPPVGIDPFIWASFGCVLSILGFMALRVVTLSELRSLLR